MTATEKLTPAQRLGAYVAHLEAENRRLGGQHVPSAAAVSLQRENADLRRQLADATARPAGGDPPEHLTIPQVAQMLDISTYEVLRNLRESLPLAVDDSGHTVVARKDVDAYLLATAQGRPTRRFL